MEFECIWADMTLNRGHYLRALLGSKRWISIIMTINESPWEGWHSTYLSTSTEIEHWSMDLLHFTTLDIDFVASSCCIKQETSRGIKVGWCLSARYMTSIPQCIQGETTQACGSKYLDKPHLPQINVNDSNMQMTITMTSYGIRNHRALPA